jgi:aryl-alcohol dehydrogenase-like predicted oxidoreductase
MPDFPARVTLGCSGLRVSKLGLGSSFKAPTRSYHEAFERGVNYFYWGSIRRGLMGAAVREIARQKREEMVIVVQSYSRSATLLAPSVELAIRRLRIDYADVLLLGWHNKEPSQRVLEAALDLKRRGRVGYIAISSHQRKFFPTLLEDESFSIWHVRYNAVHRGAERDVFPCLENRGESRRPGLVTYTTTSWGQLCDPAKVPSGEPVPTGTDCYRFALSNPRVDLCVAGPDDDEQMQQALATLERGPMNEEELAWMRRVGDHIYGGSRASSMFD